MKILLDTDIGSDLDDAVCLAYLLAHPDCELLGITTVSGEGAQRAALASVLCRAAGRDVPIRIGAEQPLLVAQRQPRAPQAVALDRWPHDTDFPAEPAVELLRRTIRAHPGEVVLLTIGPLTNVALLFAVDPEIPGLVGGLVSMAGSFIDPPRGEQEWNVLLDPHAAAMVYRARPPYHRSIGLDVTTRVTLDAESVPERFGVGLLRPVLDFAQDWFGHKDHLTFHDPLAAGTLFEPDVCSFRPGVVEVDLRTGPELGRTMWTPGGPDSPHQIATGVEPEAFLAHYFDVVTAR